MLGMVLFKPIFFIPVTFQLSRTPLKFSQMMERLSKLLALILHLNKLHGKRNIYTI